MKFRLAFDAEFRPLMDFCFAAETGYLPVLVAQRAADLQSQKFKPLPVSGHHLIEFRRIGWHDAIPIFRESILEYSRLPCSMHCQSFQKGRTANKFV